MASSLVVPQQRSHGMTIGAVFIAALVILGAMPLESASPTHLAASILMLACLATLPAIEQYRNQRLVEIDGKTRSVIVGNRLHKTGRRNYPFNRFASIRSFNTRTRSARTRLEVTSADEREILLLALFETGVVDDDASFPARRHAESEQAMAFRRRIAALMDITDQGFLGMATLRGKAPGRPASP